MYNMYISTYSCAISSLRCGILVSFQSGHSGISLCKRPQAILAQGNFAVPLGSALWLTSSVRGFPREPYTILYYTILYYTILYYTILYYTILYYTILYYTILYYTILYQAFVGPSAMTECAGTVSSRIFACARRLGRWSARGSHGRGQGPGTACCDMSYRQYFGYSLGMIRAMLRMDIGLHIKI